MVADAGLRIYTSFRFTRYVPGWIQLCLTAINRIGIAVEGALVIHLHKV